MGFERVSGHMSVIAPHFPKQGFSAHNLLSGAIKETQNRGLLLSQAQLAALVIDQQLGAGAERVVANLEDGIIAGFMLAQMGADAGEQNRKAEGLADIVIGARFQTQHRIGIGRLAGQHNDGALEPVLAHDLDRLATIHIGQADIHDDDIGLFLTGHGHCGSGILRL